MKINPLLFLILATIGLAGNVHARLGLTLEEVQKRHGNMDETDDLEYPEDIIIYEPRSLLEGFDRIKYSFFKKDRNKKCVRIFYLRYFENRESVNMGIKDGEEIIQKNFNDSYSRPKLIKESSKNIENADSRGEEWQAMYGEAGRLNKNAAIVHVGPVEAKYASGQWSFSVICSSRDYQEFLEQKVIEELKNEELKNR